MFLDILLIIVFAYIMLLLLLEATIWKVPPNMEGAVTLQVHKGEAIIERKLYGFEMKGVFTSLQTIGLDLGTTPYWRIQHLRRSTRASRVLTLPYPSAGMSTSRSLVLTIRGGYCESCAALRHSDSYDSIPSPLNSE